MKIFMIAGEESGDILGADLMQALSKKSDQQLSFFGIGGVRMQQQKMNSLFPMQELSLMGIAEILPQIPNMLKRIKHTVDEIENIQPDVLITIDAPDFSFRVAKELQKRFKKPSFMVHYVAPTVWAWRPGRAKKVANLYDAIFCLLPFEPPYFEKEGMEALFVGHPMIIKFEGADGQIFREKYDIPTDATTLGLFYGSRQGELKRMGHVLTKALKSVLDGVINPYIIIPTLPHLEPTIREFCREFECPFVITTSEEEKKHAFKACNVALATSGTVGLELAVAGVPHIIGYRMNEVTYQIVKRMVKAKYAHLANIIQDAPVISEFIQHECTEDNLSNALGELISNPKKRDAQLQAFSKVFQSIGGGRSEAPSDIASKYILQKMKV